MIALRMVLRAVVGRVPSELSDRVGRCWGAAMVAQREVTLRALEGRVPSELLKGKDAVRRRGRQQAERAKEIRGGAAVAR